MGYLQAPCDGLLTKPKLKWVSLVTQIATGNGKSVLFWQQDHIRKQ